MEINLQFFDFGEKIILENEAALLRPLEETDYKNLIHFSLSEPEIWKYSLAQPIGEEGLKNYLKAAVSGRASKTEFPFIVWDKRSRQYAGSTRLYDINASSNCLKLGYTWYGGEHQGTGLNKNCKYLLLEYAFEVLEVERVEFRADNDNLRSICAMKSIGCQEEGILRSDGYKPNGERRNSIVLSVLKSEWLGSVKENLKAKIS